MIKLYFGAKNVFVIYWGCCVKGCCRQIKSKYGHMLPNFEVRQKIEKINEFKIDIG